MERTDKYLRLMTVAVSILVIAAFYLAKGVLIPFALAVLVSFLLAPLVLRLQRWHFSRVMAVVTAVFLVFLATSATGWLVVGQIRDVTTKLSDYNNNIQDKISTLRGAVAMPIEAATKIVSNLGTDLARAVAPEAASDPTQTVRIAEPARGVLGVFREAVGPALGIMMTAAAALVFAFVMLLRWEDLGDRVIRMVGHGNILVTTKALEEAAHKVSNYLWRFLLMNSLYGLVIGIGLTCIGVPNALLWGLLAAILRFIPYVGPWVAAVCPVLVSLAVFPGWSMAMLTAGLFVLLELVTNNFLEPWIYGTGSGVSPLAILVSAFFWTWLWGPIGLVLATPLTVCLVVMGKYVPQLQFLSVLFGDAPGLSPSARLYQRLIAGDQDQAWLVLRTEIEHRTLQELYDSVVLPALSMAEEDLQRGTLDKESANGIEDAMRLLLEEAAELRPGSDSASGSTVAPAPADPLRVLCLPARGITDSLAANMLRQVLERDGAQVDVSSIAELSGETLDVLENRRVDIVCISAVPPSRFMHVRYLCKRIAGRFPKLPIVVGMWTLGLKAEELADGLPILAGVHVVTSLEEARVQVRQLAGAVRIQHEAELAVPASAQATA